MTQTSEKMYSKCSLCDVAYLISFDVYLLQIEVHYCKANCTA